MGAYGISAAGVRREEQHCVPERGDEQYGGRGFIYRRYVQIAILFEGEGYGDLRRSEPVYPAGGDGGAAVCVYLAVVRLCGSGERDHPGVFLEKRGTASVRLCASAVRLSADWLLRQRRGDEIPPIGRAARSMTAICHAGSVWRAERFVRNDRSSERSAG